MSLSDFFSPLFQSKPQVLDWVSVMVLSCFTCMMQVYNRSLQKQCYVLGTKQTIKKIKLFNLWSWGKKIMKSTISIKATFESTSVYYRFINPQFLICLLIWQPVEVCVPYRRTKRGEVVLRRFDGQSWSTLPTNLRRGSENHSCRPGGHPARVSFKISHRKKNYFPHKNGPVAVRDKKKQNLLCCSWRAARWASSPGLWQCPDRSRTAAPLHQLEPCWFPAPTMESSSTSLLTPPCRPAL